MKAIAVVTCSKAKEKARTMKEKDGVAIAGMGKIPINMFGV